MTGEECVEEILTTVDVDFEMIDGTMAHKAVSHLIQRVDELENGIDIEHKVIAFNLKQSKHIATLEGHLNVLQRWLSSEPIDGESELIAGALELVNIALASNSGNDEE